MYVQKGGYELPSFREDRLLTVQVDGSSFYPPKLIVDRIVISGAKRNCLRFRVRNITLLPDGPGPENDRQWTQAAWYFGPQGPIQGEAGDNNVFIYFAEAPKESKDGYGIFRVASTLLNYELGPPETRTPKIAELTFADEDFVIFQ